MEQLKKKVVGIAALAFAVAFGAGVASANVQAKAETDWTQFSISEASVRLGAGTAEDPSGLRFKVDCPVDYSANAEVEAYTTISFTYEGTPYTIDVDANVWRTDGSGWNTVLLDIPAAAYGAEITATSYVVVDGETQQSNTAVTSIAKTSSILLQQGATDAALVAYTQGAVSEITLDKSAATLVEGDAVKLNATISPAGFGITYSSSDESVATVDNTGKVVMQKASGSATITASMGGVSAACEVTSGGMAKVLHFDNGVNNYITAEGNDTAVCVGPRASAEENVAAATATGTLKYDPGDWDFYMGIDAAYLASVFADEAATALEYKVYTMQDGLTTKTSNAFIARSSAGGDTVWAGLGNATDMGDYLLFKITRAGYNKWLALHEDNTKAGVKMLVQMRLGLKNEDESSADYGKIIWGAVAHVYLDDFQASYPTGDFEDGDASFIGSGNVPTGDYDAVTITTSLVTREDGNHMLSVTSSNWNLNVILDETYLAHVFADSAVNSLQFKVYCDNDGIASGTNKNLAYVKDGATVRTSWAGISASEKTEDGYFTVTFDRTNYEAWVTAKGETASSLYILVRLGNWDGSVNKYAQPSNVYLDDFVAVK